MSRSAANAPGPGVRSLVSLGPQLLRDDPVEVAVTLRERYGRVVRIPPIYPGIDDAVYLITDPDAVQSILQTNANDYRGLDIPGSSDFAAAVEGSILGAPEDGRDWWVQRLRTLSPEFTADRVSRHAPAIARESVKTFAEYASSVGSTGSSQDSVVSDPAAVLDGNPGIRLNPLTARLSLRLLGDSLFASDVRLHEETVIRAIAQLRRRFKQRTFGVVTGALERQLPDRVVDRLESIRRIGAPNWIDHETDPLNALREVADALVDRRARLSGVFDDAPATWLERPDPTTGNVLDRDAVAAEVTGLLIAGHATVAATLSWAGVLLASHPDIQERVAAEARNASLLSGDRGGADGEPWTYAAVADALPTAFRVWQEILRLYPALPVYGRTSRCRVTLASYSFPADTTLLVSPYVTQRDPASVDHIDSRMISSKRL